VSKFFLFYALLWLTRNPLLALLLVLAIYLVVDRRYLGILPDLSSLLRDRRRMSRLRREVLLNPENAEAQSDLGRELVRRGKYGEGVEHLEKALPKMTEIAETRFYLGVGLLRTGRLDPAESQLKKALEIDPRYGYGEPHLRLGDLYRMQGRSDQALAAYRAFTRIHTSSAEGFFKIGELLREQGDFHGAREAYGRAVAAFKGSPPHKKRIDRPWVWRARWRLLGMGREGG